MTREELKDVKLGDILIEGKDHFISVNRLLEDPENPDRVEYFEDDYYHEVNCEYLSKLSVDKDNLMIGDAIEWTVCGSENVRIRFVHELQHAMRLYGLNEEAKNLKVN